jgi:hypothetical protein
MDYDAFARTLWTGRADAYERGFARLTVHAAGPLLDATGAGAGWRSPAGTTRRRQCSASPGRPSTRSA